MQSTTLSWLAQQKEQITKQNKYWKRKGKKRNPLVMALWKMEWQRDDLTTKGKPMEGGFKPAKLSIGRAHCPMGTPERMFSCPRGGAEQRKPRFFVAVLSKEMQTILGREQQAKGFWRYPKGSVEWWTVGVGAVPGCGIPLLSRSVSR